MDLHQLRIFIAVADYKSFSKAANAVFLSQSGVSYQIASLENSLKAQLFHRGPRDVALTEVGEYCYGVIKKMLTDFDDMIGHVNDMVEDVTSKLSIGVTGGHEIKQLATWVGKFIRRYPNISVELSNRWVDFICSDVESNILDLGFTMRFEGKRFPNIECRPIFVDHLVVAMNANHPLASRKSLKLADLCDQPFLHINMAQKGGANEGLEWRKKLCRKRGFIMNVVQTFPTFQTLFMAVEAGVGLGLFGQQIVEGNAPPTVHYVPLEDEDCQYEYCAIWKKEITNPNLDLFLRSSDLVSDCPAG
ncbi:LysR family transcriptional regulator [Holophaga foetida]|uniref:LysR family transcriptional regulator n=1 Tax=Holophaga foetida TaxID=35839 RepID=UPI0002474CC0|nr:LysR family transcriptional regulator [Holophaga foetida]